jgi:histidinol-phosphate phosphatase family protein
MKRAVFLDRDGVINTSCGVDQFGRLESPLRLEDLMIFPYVGKCVLRLNQLGFLVFIVTNQPAIAKGKMSLDELVKIHTTIRCHIYDFGGNLKKIYTCLHHPDSSQVKVKSLLRNCDCRKPKPGMLLQSKKEYDLDLQKSWMVGDSWKDIMAGQSAGCQTILVRPTEFELKHTQPDFSVYTLNEAVKIIEKQETKNVDSKRKLHRQKGKE